MMKTANLTALVFTLSLSLAAIQPTSAMALGLTDLLEAGKGHLRDLGDRLTHDEEFVYGSDLATGEFRDDDPGVDAAHWAVGTVSIVSTDEGIFIQLGEDFKAGLAPDLYIYTADRKVVDERSFKRAKTTEVSMLKSGSGAQYYKIDAIPSEVIIWCKRFGQFMGAATVN